MHSPVVCLKLQQHMRKTCQDLIDAPAVDVDQAECATPLVLAEKTYAEAEAARPPMA